jgi:hypothetical protein
MEIVALAIVDHVVPFVDRDAVNVDPDRTRRSHKGAEPHTFVPVVPPPVVVRR